MSFELSAAQLEHIDLMLKGLSDAGEINIALYNASKRAMQTARTAAWKEVKSEYTIKRTAFYRETKITATSSGSRSTGGIGAASLSFSGNVISLLDFDYSADSSGRHISVGVKRGNMKAIKDAYKANLGVYGEAIFERAAPRRNSSETLYGPPAAEMVGNETVLEKISKKVGQTFVDRVEHEVDRILRGYV